MKEHDPKLMAKKDIDQAKAIIANDKEWARVWGKKISLAEKKAEHIRHREAGQEELRRLYEEEK